VKSLGGSFPSKITLKGKLVGRENRKRKSSIGSKGYVGGKRKRIQCTASNGNVNGKKLLRGRVQKNFVESRRIFRGTGRGKGKKAMPEDASANLLLLKKKEKEEKENRSLRGKIRNGTPKCLHRA